MELDYHEPLSCSQIEQYNTRASRWVANSFREERQQKAALPGFTFNPLHGRQFSNKWGTHAILKSEETIRIDRR
jgi:hypothetical protein